MTDDQHGNQSIFSDAIQDWQAPPEVDMTPEGIQKREKQNRKRLYIGGGIFGGLITLLVAYNMLFSYINRPEEYVPYPTPTPIPTPKSTRTQDELARIQFLLDQANPQEEYIAPPTVELNSRL